MEPKPTIKGAEKSKLFCKLRINSEDCKSLRNTKLFPFVIFSDTNLIGRVEADKHENYRLNFFMSYCSVKQTEISLETNTATIILRYYNGVELIESEFTTGILSKFGSRELLAKGIRFKEDEINYVIEYLLRSATLAPTVKSFTKHGFVEKDENLSYYYRSLLGNTKQSDLFVYRGDKDLASHGELTKWIEMIQSDIIGNQALEFVMLSSFASPIIAALNLRYDLGSLLIHLTNHSSKGKTTAAMLAASIWGNPMLNRGTAISYNSTENALADFISGCNGMCVVLDESSVMQTSNLQKFLFEVTLGRSKMRLQGDGMKGLRENAYQCKWTGGIPPLGYDVNEEKKLVINEKEAEAVRLIFEMTADGEGYGAIINKLNILGYKTKKGRTFGKNSLYDLLRNERYKGTYIFNKRSKANYQNKRNNHRFKNDDEIIRIENGCPAIVSESLWNRANAVKKATRCSYTNAKHPYLLTGLLYCAECGAKMHGNCRQDRYGIRSTGYRCSSRTNKHACNCKEIRCSKLDNFVIDKFKQYFFNDENIKVITEKVNQKLNDNSILANECKEVKNNLRTLKIQRNNLVDAIAQTGINQTLKDKLNECEDNIAKAEAFIQHCESQKIDCTVTEEDIKKLIDELKEYMSNPTSLVTTKFILSQYIERVDVSNETILVTLKVTLPPTAGGNSFCPIILHTESIRRKKVINSSALDNTFLL